MRLKVETLINDDLLNRVDFNFRYTVKSNSLNLLMQIELV